MQRGGGAAAAPLSAIAARRIQARFPLVMRSHGPFARRARVPASRLARALAPHVCALARSFDAALL
jgi:hypothetical protein